MTIWLWNAILTFENLFHQNLNCNTYVVRIKGVVPLCVNPKYGSEAIRYSSEFLTWYKAEVGRKHIAVMPFEGLKVFEILMLRQYGIGAQAILQMKVKPLVHWENNQIAAIIPLIQSKAEIQSESKIRPVHFELRRIAEEIDMIIEKAL